MSSQLPNTPIDELISNWQSNTVAFVQQALGVGCNDDGMQIEPWQIEAMQIFDKIILAKEKASRKEQLSLEESDLSSKLGITIKSGKGAGKTALFAWLAVKFLTMFSQSKILATAPKQDLLRDNLWGEIAKWRRYAQKTHGSNFFVFKNMTVQADKVVMSSATESNNREWYMVARTASRSASPADQKATLQGYHASYMLVLCDESYGIPDPVFEPLTTTLTGEVNLVVLGGNPGKTHGYAHNTFYGKDAKYYCPITVNCETLALITPEHIKRQKEIYIDNPNGYRVNVLGEEPLEDADALIPYSSLTQAKERTYLTQEYIDEPTISAADIGAGGDNTAVCHIQGPHVYPIKQYSSPKPEEVIRFITQEAIQNETSRLAIDGIGIGWAVTPALLAEGIDTLSVDVRLSAFDHERFFNLRSELYWKLREAVMQFLSLPDDDELINQLASIKLDNSGDAKKIKVMSKEKMRKLNGDRSPNKADSLMLAQYFTHSQLKYLKGQKQVDVQERYHTQTIEERSGFMSV